MGQATQRMIRGLAAFAIGLGASVSAHANGPHHHAHGHSFGHVHGPGFAGVGYGYHGSYFPSHYSYGYRSYSTGFYGSPYYSSSFYASFPAYSSYSYQGWPYRSSYWSSGLWSSGWIAPSFTYRTYYRPVVVPRVYYSYRLPIYYQSSCFAVPTCSVPISPVPICSYAPADSSDGTWEVPSSVDSWNPTLEVGFSNSDNVIASQGPIRSSYLPAKLYGEPVVAAKATSSSESMVDGLHVVSSSDLSKGKPVRLLTPTSNDWAESAIGLTDLMIQQGDSFAAVDACGRMLEIRQQLPAGIPLRFGVLSALQGKSTTEALSVLQTSYQSGSRLLASEFPGGNLRSYAAGDSRLNIDQTLDRLAKTVLDSTSGEDLLLLGILLRLDGQEGRAKPLIELARHQLQGNLQALASGLID